MSNIVLKGDVIQNIGEYLPNPYIEKINVEDFVNGFALEIEYSILVQISDDYSISDVIDSFENLNFYSVVYAEGETGPRTKRDLMNSLLLQRNATQETSRLSVQLLHTGAGINESRTNYEDNIYDSEDRRIIKITNTVTQNVNTDLYSGIDPVDNKEVYVYVFCSMFTIGYTPGFAMPQASVLYMSTSNIAYEKVFSPNFNVLKEELPIYLTTEGEKYGQAPLLGLDRRFYQNRTVSREQIISKVRSLVSRFNGSSNSALQQNIDNINLVLSTESDSENLLVELDKVRRSFTSKTNNNPIGNLYTAYSILLQNINSSFPRTERLNKQKYLTGKILDMRVGLPSGYVLPEPSDEIEYIPSGLFSINRERTESYLTGEDVGINRGNFFIRYEEMLKRESDIFKIISQEKFYEIESNERTLNDLRRILFSYFSVTYVHIIKSKDGNEISKTQIAYNPNFEISNGAGTYERHSDQGVMSRLTHQNFSFSNPDEVLLSYHFTDTDSFTAIEDIEEVESNGGIVFDYTVECKIKDNTYNFVEYLVQKYTDIFDSFKQYRDYANELCSYNNIDNRFNSFFTKNIRDEYPSGDYPWEQAPAIYSIMVHLLTEQFSSFNEAKRFCKNESANINPEQGSREQLNSFYGRMQSLKIQVDDLQNQILGRRNISITKDNEISVSLVPINYEEILDDTALENLVVSAETTADDVFTMDIYSTENQAYFYQGDEIASRTDLVQAGMLLNETIASPIDKQLLYIDMKEKIEDMASVVLVKYTTANTGTTPGGSTNLSEKIEQSGINQSQISEIGKLFNNFIGANEILFRGKRDRELKSKGMNSVFDFELPSNPMSDLYRTTAYSSGTTLRALYLTLAQGLESLLGISGVAGNESMYQSAALITLNIMSYYRDNTHRLVTNINKISLQNTVTSDPFIDAIYEADGVFNSIDGYTGPSYEEIPNIEEYLSQLGDN
jgi:hypothetical protein